MPRLFVGNFDFEYELAAFGDPTYRVPEIARRMSMALATAWLGVAEAEDYLLAPRPIADDDLPDLVAASVGLPSFVTRTTGVPDGDNIELVPWGWTPGTVALAAEHGWRTAAPPLEIVRTVNSREFRLQLEQEFGVALPQAGVARSLDELRALLTAAGELPLGWIFKANFGMSGRESIRGRGTQVPDTLARWAERRLQTTGAIVFEPVLDRVAEAGLQIEIPANAPPRLVGVAELIVDKAGVYRGSRFKRVAGDRAMTSPTANEEEQTVNSSCEGSARASDAWKPAVSVGLQVAQRLQSLGYFGPLGIDAMQYRDPNGRLRLRPLQDLNARLTLGRLALGFRRLLPPGWCARWLWLPAQSRGTIDGPQPSHLAGRDQLKILRTSPATSAAAEPQSLLVLASSPTARAAAELRITSE